MRFGEASIFKLFDKCTGICTAEGQYLRIPIVFCDSSNPVLSAQKPWFSQLSCISGQFLWLSCLSMHVHAYRCCVVLCAALAAGESFSESPESSSKARFYSENMLFCRGGAGFELGKRCFGVRVW